MAGERIAVKVYNPTADAWDTIGTITGSGSVSEAIDIATYADNDVVHVMAVLDYVTNGSNTMIWVTDPQHYTKFEDLNAFYYEIYEYAAQEYVAGNVGYIINTGDLVDDVPAASASAAQWDVADNAMQIIEAVGMPNGLVAGNHDVNTVKNTDYSSGVGKVDYSKFAAHFGADRYNNAAWYGGSLNNNTSHYDLITIGNTDFIILYLGYGVEATDETITWANSVLQTYSHRTAIIATHQYLEASTADHAVPSRADLIYNEIVDPNPNVKMVICGHDDGSIVNEVTASDGRIVYEMLSDYQFVEAESDAFYEEYYKNIDPDGTYKGHYIGSVPECCGDGYIRLLTVEGGTLSSVTYSPVTDRYNPFGDRENITIDLGVNPPDRELTTVNFSAYILGEESTEDFPSVPTAIVITKASDNNSEEEVIGALEAATPDMPYTDYAVAEAPAVEFKTDILAAAGLSNGVVNTAWTPYYNLGLTVDLTKTPYLYYSITVPENAHFTFALVNNTNYAPWLVFRDATGEGAYLNNGAGNWDSYTNREQYITASETGCVDMRDISTDPNKATWIVNQLTFYNALGIGVTVNYMFFGSEPITQEPPVDTNGITTYHHCSYTDYPEISEPEVSTPVDLEALNALIATAEELDTSLYTDQSVTYFNIVLGDAKSVDTTNANDVSLAYYFLTCMLGAMKLIPEAPIDPATLESVHLYDMTASKWNTTDTTKTPLDPNGFTLSRETSRETTNGWASVNCNDTYSIKANNGKIYLNLDVEADCAWSIHIVAAQANCSGTIVVNHAIDNAFHSITCDSFNGTYQGVYDITEAFEKYGMDPAATINISKTYLYIVPGDGAPKYEDLATNPDTVTYRYVEFMTDVSSGTEVDKSALQALIDEVAALDSSLYTTTTWNALQTVIIEANRTMNSTGLHQADINLTAIKVAQAKEKLKLISEIVPEPEGSLLPADEGKWVPSEANVMNIYRDDSNHTVLQNTNGAWPKATYTLPQTMNYSVADHQIAVDVTVGSQGRIDICINGKWININKYITTKLDGGSGDMLAGSYTANIPLSKLVTDSQNAAISGVEIYTIGEAVNSAVIIPQLQIIDYVAPPHVEEERLNLLPETDEQFTLVSGEGNVTIENGVMKAVNTGDTDLRITLDKKDLFNLKVLNSLHMDFETDVPFKMAFYVVSSVEGGGAQWLNTSSNYPSLFTVENDGAAAGDYDVNMEIRDLVNNVTDKSSCYFDQFIILVKGKGTFTLNVAEMIEHDNFEWDEDLTTYGEAATPDAPYFEHAAQTPPEVAEKYDLLKAINYPTHPTITGWTMIGNQATAPLGLEIDISKTPYLYYSFAMEEGANFTFSLYSNSNYAPWLSFLDSHIGGAKLNQGAANWDSYQNREQYATTSQTGCIDMREYLKDPNVQKWIINQITFYNSTGKNVLFSYFFFGSEPIQEEEKIGDLNNDDKIDIADAVFVFRAANGRLVLSEAEKAIADVNKDGKVDIADATMIFRYANGRIATLD